MSRMSEAHIEHQEQDQAMYASDGYIEWAGEQEQLAEAWQIVITDLRANPMKMKIFKDELGVNYDS